MEKLNIVAEAAREHHKKSISDENGRHRSWEHCYVHFIKERGRENVDYDYLSLHLAFYLASWGMYRGSSFLLQKDYQAHIPVVEKILNKRYDALAGSDCVGFKEESNRNLLKEISGFLEEYYGELRSETKKQKFLNPVSATLITKVLMETLGCVPAYDRYFVKGIKNYNVAQGTYNEESIMQLVDFYGKNFEQLEFVRKEMKIVDIAYPQMKVLDMGLWQLGFECDKNT